MPPPLALSLHPPSLLSPPQVCTVPLRALPPPPRSGRISLPPALPLRTHLRNPRPAPRVASCFAASRHGPGPGGRCGALAPAAPRRGRRPSCGGHLRRHGEEQWRTRRRRRRTEEAEGDPSVRGRLVPDRLHFRRRRSGFGRFSPSLVLIRVALGLLGPMGLHGWELEGFQGQIVASLFSA
jgi:hypothetical protein